MPEPLDDFERGGDVFCGRIVERREPFGKIVGGEELQHDPNMHQNEYAVKCITRERGASIARLDANERPDDAREERPVEQERERPHEPHERPRSRGGDGDAASGAFELAFDDHQRSVDHGSREAAVRSPRERAR